MKGMSKKSKIKYWEAKYKKAFEDGAELTKDLNDMGTMLVSFFKGINVRLNKQRLLLNALQLYERINKDHIKKKKLNTKDFNKFITDFFK